MQNCGEALNFWHFLFLFLQKILVYIKGFPGGSDGKEFACNVGDAGLIPGSGKSPGEIIFLNNFIYLVIFG